MTDEAIYKRVGGIMERLDETLSRNKPRTAGADAYRSLAALRGDLRAEMAEDRARVAGKGPLPPDIPQLVDAWLADPNCESRRALWEALKGLRPLAGPWLQRNMRFEAIPEHGDFPHGYQYALKVT